MMPEFQSLPWLYLKGWILMGACAIAAVGFLDTRSLIPKGSGRSIATLCVSLPLGVTGLLLAGYLSLRLVLLMGLPRPLAASAIMSGAVALLGVVLFVWRVARRWHSSGRELGGGGRRAVGAPLVFLALAAMGILPLLPLALSSDIVFYAGVDTDATGYVRTARSMMEGWYFEPIPQITLMDVLYHTDRAWTYVLIASRDRPLVFYLIALVATLCRLNPFQAYLVVESMAVVLISAMALFLVFAFSRFEGFLRVIVALLALALVMTAGLTGDLFRQFLGHVWSIVAGIVLAPILFWVCLRARRSSWSLPLSAFTVALIAIGMYDVRFALFTLAASIGAWAILPTTDWRHRAGAVVLAIAAVIGASVVGGGADRDLSSLRGFNVNQFPDIKLSLDAFLVEAGLEWPPTAWFRHVWIALSAAILLAQGLAFGDAVRMRPEPQEAADEGFRFLSNCAFLLHFGSLVAVFALTCIGNDWAAHKTLFWVAAAQAINGTLWLVSLGNRRSYPMGAVVGLVVGACALVALQTTWHWARKVVEKPAGCGVIARQGLLEIGPELETTRPDVVWFDGALLEWVVFYSHFQDGRWAALAPYSLWYHGGGLFHRTGQLADPDVAVAPRLPLDVSLKRVYGTTLHRPEVQQARTIVAVVAADVSAAWPQARCGRPYCVVPISLDELMGRATQSAR